MNSFSEMLTSFQGAAKRSIVASSLGCHYYGAALPHCDPDHPDTLQAGILKRFVLEPPKANRVLLRRLKRFTLKYCKAHLVPLAADSDLSVEHWIEGTNYPLWRKKQLLDKWKEIGGNIFNKKKFWQCKSFMKDEPYVEYKHARAINSRTDEFKCLVGPIFKLIEKEVFKLPSFVKNIPVKDRPQYILDMLVRPGSRVYPTDYSAFESLFVDELMDAVEFVLYDYMTQHLTEHNQFRWFCENVLAGENECVFKFFRVKIRAKRMSGEMNTSLGNGFSNLIFTEFVAKQHKIRVKSVHEGDDGLITSDSKIETSWFTELGLIIKMEEVDNINEASFCGIIFDLHDKINVTDPRKVLCSFGWTTHQYARCGTNKRKMLLRCKALSLIYQYPGCPIIQELGRYGLRVTRSFDVRSFIQKRVDLSVYEREKLLKALDNYDPTVCVEPGDRTRLLMERMYGITVQQQLQIEEYLRSLDAIEPLRIPQVQMHIHPHWIHYWDNYVMNDEFGDWPPALWQKISGFMPEWNEDGLIQ